MTRRSKPPRQPPQAILFDWDNTLVDNWTTIHEASNAALAAMGHKTWTLAETKQRARESLRDRFPRMFGDRWQEARRIFYDTFTASHLKTLQAKDGAADMLKSLGTAGFYLGVVSNKRGDLLRKEATHLGWSNYFGRIVGAGDAAADKPAVEPVHLALAESGLRPGDRIWFVGDAAIDMECAHKAGCVAVLIGPGDGDDRALAQFVPDLRISGCPALADLAVTGISPI